MEDIDKIQDLSTNNEWKIVEAKEYTKMRNQLEVTTADLEEVVHGWDFEYERCKQLEKKVAFLQWKLKSQDDQHERMLQKYMQLQHDSDELKTKYEEQTKEKKLFKEKFEKRENVQTPLEKIAPLVKQSTEQSLPLIEKQSMKHATPHTEKPQTESLVLLKILPRNTPLLAKRTSMKNELKLLAIQQRQAANIPQPTPPSPEPPIFRKPVRVLRFRSQPVNTEKVTRLMPSPPKDTVPPLAYRRRRHGSSIHLSETNRRHLSKQSVAEFQPSTPTTASSKSVTSASDAIHRLR